MTPDVLRGPRGLRPASPGSFGMRRSSRSIPTGPGSRGGQPRTAAYYRAWRAAHPEYRQREVERVAERKREARLERDRRWVDELVAA